MRVLFAMPDMSEYRFITTEQQHRRIKYLLEAIDTGDTDLYWKDRRHWNRVHGHADHWSYLIPPATPILTKKQVRRLQQYRECFGQYDRNHTFCTDICSIRGECTAQAVLIEKNKNLVIDTGTGLK